MKGEKAVNQKQKSLTIVVIVVAGLAVTAIGSNPRYIENLAIGGGCGDADGGAELSSDGEIETDAHVWAASGVLAPQVGPAADGDLLELDSGALTVNGTVTASAGVDGVHQFGRARIGYEGTTTDMACFAHEDHMTLTGAGFRQDSDGSTSVNAPSGETVGLYLNYSASDRILLNSTGVSIAKDLLVNGGDIGITGDTDLLGLASGELSINGDVNVHDGGAVIEDTLISNTGTFYDLTLKGDFTSTDVSSLGPYAKVGYTESNSGTGARNQYTPTATVPFHVLTGAKSSISVILTNNGGVSWKLSYRDASGANHSFGSYYSTSWDTTHTAPEEIRGYYIYPGGDSSADTNVELEVASGTLEVDGDVTLGDVSTDTISCTGRFFPRQVNDAGMNSTDGTIGEVVFNTNDRKFYGCTASGTPATWAAFH